MEVKMFDILLDNYMYLLVDTETREAAAVDVVTQPERVSMHVSGRRVEVGKAERMSICSVLGIALTL